MNTIYFLGDWALRSSILIVSGGLLLVALRVKDSSIRLAAWTAMLCGSLVIPVLTGVLPKISLTVIRNAAPMGTVYEVSPAATSVPTDFGVAGSTVTAARRLDWTDVASAIYFLIAFGLLLRLGVGLIMSRRLLGASRLTGRSTEGIEIRESDSIGSPVTLGIARSVILLPVDWNQWSNVKLDAVLAHERSHIHRRDPAVQLLSAIHRALLWHSPLSWFLHQRIVRAAEEASDDAAVAITHDRAVYADVLLDFMQRSLRRPNWLGVPMARYGRPDERIHRILDGKVLSRGITRWSLALILVLETPLAYLAAAAHPESAQPARTPSELSVAIEPLPVKPAGDAIPKIPTATLARRAAAPTILSQAAVGVTPKPAITLTGLGTVMPLSTVMVRSRVDGQLMSLKFKEGDPVQQGDLLATIDSQPYQLQVDRSEKQIALVREQIDELKRVQAGPPARQHDPQITAPLFQLQDRLNSELNNYENAKLQLSVTSIRAPITGIVGLRMIDPGNMVHTDSNIVVITQLQPIAVLFTIPEDNLPAVRTHLKDGTSLVVEAWNRDLTAKIATGRLTAMNNQIDPASGTIKLKAVFENKDEALFPNQFVNVRLAP